MKYCINCNHYKWDYDTGNKWGMCNHPNNFKRNVVSGGFDIKYSRAYLNRDDPKSCGISGKWFEPKEPKLVKMKKLFRGG